MPAHSRCSARQRATIAFLQHCYVFPPAPGRYRPAACRHRACLLGRRCQHASVAACRPARARFGLPPLRCTHSILYSTSLQPADCFAACWLRRLGASQCHCPLTFFSLFRPSRSCGSFTIGTTKTFARIPEEEGSLHSAVRCKRCTEGAASSLEAAAYQRLDALAAEGNLGYEQKGTPRAYVVVVHTACLAPAFKDGYSGWLDIVVFNQATGPCRWPPSAWMASSTSAPRFVRGDAA